MAVHESTVKCELLEPVNIKTLSGNYYSESTDEYRISALVTYNGEPFPLSGSVKGYAVRSDDVTVSFNGSISGNKASAKIPQSALVPGKLLVTLTLVDGIEETTIAAVLTFVLEGDGF